jgi:hypothetical protein
VIASPALLEIRDCITTAHSAIQDVRVTGGLQPHGLGSGFRSAAGQVHEGMATDFLRPMIAPQLELEEDGDSN